MRGTCLSSRCVVVGQGPEVQGLHKLSWCSKATVSGCSGVSVPMLQPCPHLAVMQV